MKSKPDRTPKSRRDFLETTATGVAGASAGWIASKSSAAPTAALSPHDLGQLTIVSGQSMPMATVGELRLRFEPRVQLAQGAKLWLFFDIRQGAEVPQTEDPKAPNFLRVRHAHGDIDANDIELPRIPRTFDLLPTVPEFLHLVAITVDRRIDVGESIEFVVQRWVGPKHPIRPFRFWLTVDHDGSWDFVSTGFRRYRAFVRRGTDSRIESDRLLAHTLTADLSVSGTHAAVSPSNCRETDGVFWGEFHGMVFNQRPLSDYYDYAKRVTKLDFCAPFGFSYNTCVANVWDDVKAAARTYTEPGKFLAIAGFECGTPPDGSHRCVIFPHPENVPPIFCEHRAPALDPFFQRRLHPDTIICRSPDELYDVVTKYGGLITGHYHTRSYHKEVLCEMFQKNLRTPAEEEERLYGLLRNGKRFALAGTSDTHDSMPGNPNPEVHLPMPAGFTGVHAAQLTTESVFEAVRARRIYATSGARILVRFHSSDRPMGSELPVDAPRQFQIEVDGTATLGEVELLRDGRPIQRWTPGTKHVELSAEDERTTKERTSFYLVRVTQTDNHKAWTSPIWFG